MEKIIEVKQLKKNYGRIEAVKGISFYVERGKLFSFLGPNGAGKSTTIDMLCTLLAADSGEVRIDGNDLGRDSSRIREQIGVVFQDSVLDAMLSVRENLMIRAGFYIRNKKQRAIAVRNAAEAADILEVLDRPYGKLSGGQRRRADIARALINQPKILFLDEPTTGLDPGTRKTIWKTIRQLQQENGMTVFLTTHYMEEAAQSDYVIVMDHGKIAAKGTPTGLKEQYAYDQLFLSCTEQQKVREILESRKIRYHEAAERLVIRINNTIDALPLIELCRPWISGLEVINGTMDDAFLGITGEELSI